MIDDFNKSKYQGIACFLGRGKAKSSQSRGDVRP